MGKEYEKWLSGLTEVNERGVHMSVIGIEGKRVLLIADSFSSKASGGLVSLRMANFLVDAGAIVKIFCPSNNKLTPCNIFDESKSTKFYRKNSGFLHIIPGKNLRLFKSIIDDFNPDVIHFCSLDYSKSRYFFKYAHGRHIKLIAQPWIYNFYCAQGYDYIDGHDCGCCVSGHFYNALVHKCGPTHSRLLQLISRLLLRRDVLQSDIFLSTNQDMDARLLRYGVPSQKIIRLPLPFDPQRTEGLPVCDGKDFIFYGQFQEFKGAHLLQHIISYCPLTMFFLYPIVSSEEQLIKYGIDQSKLHNVRVDTDLSWFSGLAERVATCRGVLFPSLWPTSTEYALLEAMGLSKPIVAFDVGAHQEILVHHKNAMVVPAGDTRAFSEAILELDQNADLRQEIGYGARQTFKKLTNSKILVAKLAEAYLGTTY